MLFGFGFVRAVKIRRPHRGVVAQQLVVPVRVAGTMHGIARGLDEAQRMRA